MLRACVHISDMVMLYVDHATQARSDRAHTESGRVLWWLVWLCVLAGAASSLRSRSRVHLIKPNEDDAMTARGHGGWLVGGCV